MKKPYLTAALVAIAFSPMSAWAQSTPSSSAPTATAATAPTVGAKVFDPQGEEVGSIEKIDPAGAVVFTGTKRATLPLAAFASNDKGLLISMSQAELNSAVAAAESHTDTSIANKLNTGAAIKSKDGVAVGTVKAIEGENVTITLRDGNPVTVTKQYLTVDSSGSLALTMNESEFKSAVSAASAASAG